MYRDEIIAEVWRNRDAYVKQHNCDLRAIIEDLRARERTPHGRLVDRRNAPQAPQARRTVSG